MHMHMLSAPLRALRTRLASRRASRLASMGATSMYRVFIGWLDATLFPLCVTYVTHPVVILATICLLVPLVILANVTQIVLLSNSYLNVASASVSSIVLMQSLRHHKETKRLHGEHAEQIAALHAKIDALTVPGVPGAPGVPTPVPTVRKPRGTAVPK